MTNVYAGRSRDYKRIRYASLDAAKLFADVHGAPFGEIDAVQHAVSAEATEKRSQGLAPPYW